MLSAAASWGWGQKEHSGRGLLRTVYKRKTLRLFNSRASQLTFLTHRKKHLEPGRTMITHFVDCNLVLCLRCPLPISPNGQFQKERPVPGPRAGMPTSQPLARPGWGAGPAPPELTVTYFSLLWSWQIACVLRSFFLCLFLLSHPTINKTGVGSRSWRRRHVTTKQRVKSGQEQ